MLSAALSHPTGTEHRARGRGRPPPSGAGAGGGGPASQVWGRKDLIPGVNRRSLGTDTKARRTALLGTTFYSCHVDPGPWELTGTGAPCTPPTSAPTTGNRAMELHVGPACSRPYFSLPAPETPLPGLLNISRPGVATHTWGGGSGCCGLVRGPEQEPNIR